MKNKYVAIAWMLITSCHGSPKLSRLDRCLNSSQLILVETDKTLDRLVHVYDIKVGGVKSKRLLEVYSSKDSLQESLITSFDSSGYAKLLDLDDSLLFGSYKSPSDIYGKLGVVGSDSLLKSLSIDQPTFYKQVIDLNSWKVKMYFARRMDYGGCGFSKIYLLGNKTGESRVNLVLISDESSLYARVDSVYLDKQLNLEVGNNITLSSLNINLGFSFDKTDNVDLKLELNNPYGITVFPFKWEQGN